MHVLGKTGMGKTSMLENMAVQDILAGNGLGFIDPHGEAVENILNFVPQSRIEDVLYFNPADMTHPVAFNVMEEVDPEYRHLVASGLMSVFKKIFGPEVWSARMEYILNYTILALLECPGSTLLGINRMLSDIEYRKTVVDQVKDPVVKAFWVKEYARYTGRYEVEATAAIQNKVGQFISSPLIRNVVGQVHSSVDMRQVMDGQKILLANLSKGKIGEDNSRLLGALLVTKLQLAAMSRVDMPESERKDFFLYIDEFQNFATDSFVNILSEARKYRLSLILSHQYIAQLGTGIETKVRDAVFGNVGTIVTFRIGAEDGEFMEKEFAPHFLIQDFINLTKYNIYVKLMIDGIAGRPFSAQTLPPPAPTESPHVREVVEASRRKFSTPQEQVEQAMAEWTGFLDTGPVQQQQGQGQSFDGQSQTLYDAICSMCGKPTKVVFPPDGKRPVYCKVCRKKRQQERESSQQSGEGAPRSFQAERMQNPQQNQRTGQNREPSQSFRPAPFQRPQPVSLKEAASAEPVFFQPNHREPQKKKEVNRDEVRQALSEAVLQGQRTEKKRGTLRPGETISL